jgi:hypothetical protein
MTDKPQAAATPAPDHGIAPPIEIDQHPPHRCLRLDDRNMLLAR